MITTVCDGHPASGVKSHTGPILPLVRHPIYCMDAAETIRLSVPSAYDRYIAQPTGYDVTDGRADRDNQSSIAILHQWAYRTV